MKNEEYIDIYPSLKGSLIGTYKADREDFWDILNYFRQKLEERVEEEAMTAYYSYQSDGKYEFSVDGEKISPMEWKHRIREASDDASFSICFKNLIEDEIMLCFSKKNPKDIRIDGKVNITLSYWDSLIELFRRYGFLTNIEASLLKWKE